MLSLIDDSRFFECINPEEMEKEEINLRSAAVEYSFSVWKEGRPDPSDNMSLEEIIQKYKLFTPPHRHFWDYVERKAPDLAKKVRSVSS